MVTASKKKAPRSVRVSFRLTETDEQLLATLVKKVGLAQSQIVRLGLRALATKEGVSA